MRHLNPQDKKKLKDLLLGLKIRWQSLAEVSTLLHLADLESYVIELPGETNAREMIDHLMANLSTNDLINLLVYIRECHCDRDEQRQAFEEFIYRIEWNIIENQTSHQSIKKLLNTLKTRATQAANYNEAKLILKAAQQIIAHPGAKSKAIRNIIASGEFPINICDILETVESQLSQPISIILLVMNRTEADDLKSGNAFGGNHNGLRNDFEQLREQLSENGITDWIDNYQESPQDWTPFNSRNTIKQLIEEALSRIEAQIGGFYPLRPEFIDIHQLNAGENWYRLKQLREQDCIIIKDAISLRHPNLQCALRKTALDAFPNTAIAMITPILPFPDSHSNQELDIVVRQLLNLEFCRRVQCNQENCKTLAVQNEISNDLITLIRQILPDEVNQEFQRPSVRNFMFGF